MTKAKPVAPKAAKPAAKKPSGIAAAVDQALGKDPVRVAAGKKGAPIAQATRSVVELAPAKPSIARNAAAKDVDKMIVSIKGRGAKLDNDIHSTAMACMFHADTHGDVTLMCRLLLALPKSTRRNALAQWAVKFGKFTPNEDVNTMKERPLDFDKSAKTDFDGAQAMPFWDFKNVKEGTTEWLFSNFIEGVMKSLANHAAQQGPEGQKAKAAFDALSSVTEALAITPAAPLPAGVAAERRGAATPANVH